MTVAAAKSAKALHASATEAEEASSAARSADDGWRWKRRRSAFDGEMRNRKVAEKDGGDCDGGKVGNDACDAAATE